MLGERLYQGQKKAEKLFKLQYANAEVQEQHWLFVYGYTPFRPSLKEWKKSVIGVYRKTRATCSSPWCCGNKRSVYGQTRRELKQLGTARQDLMENTENNKQFIGGKL